MITVVLTIHVLIVLALIGIVLIQRSEGGALGMGGGGGNFMTGRGAATALTRTTSALAALFFVTSLGLAMLAERRVTDEALIDELTGRARTPQGQDAPAGATTQDLLRTLGAEPSDRPAAPAAETESAPGPAPAAEEPGPQPEASEEDAPN